MRGRGLGRRLLGVLEACAFAGGGPVARLETGGVLTEALSLYRSAGWVEVPPFNDEPFADHWFEKTQPPTPADRRRARARARRG